MINDDEFKQVMCDHMQQQTAFLATISSVATTYHENWRVIKGVYRFLKWVIVTAIGGLGLIETWHAVFPRK